MIRVRKMQKSRKPALARQQLQAVYDGLNGNANFTTPNPALPTYLTKLTAIDAKLSEISDAEAALRAMREQRDELIGAAFLMYGQLGSYVENISGSDRAKAESSGFELVNDSPSSPPPLTKPGNVAASTGDDDNEMDVQWDADSTVDAFEVQSSPDPITPTSFVHAATVAVSHVTLTNLPAMAKRWARVRAVRGGVNGPWSDPACAVVT